MGACIKTISIQIAQSAHCPRYTHVISTVNCKRAIWISNFKTRRPKRAVTTLIAKQQYRGKILMVSFCTMEPVLSQIRAWASPSHCRTQQDSMVSPVCSITLAISSITILEQLETPTFNWTQHFIETNSKMECITGGHSPTAKAEIRSVRH